MLISVIIPVYNAEEYVRQAVESAITQPETGEVILVEDASPDSALQVCQELTKEYSNVKLLRHSDGKNHGTAASRNLGIRNTTFEYIAFLDADDYYLPGRFQVAKELLESCPDIDGVYEGTGTYFHEEKNKEDWFWRNKTVLTTMTKVIDPDCLFESLLGGKLGSLHLNGLLVRKAVFDKTGYFDEIFELRDDSAMWYKIAALSKLIPGRLAEPVSMRRVHGKNRISASKEKFAYEGILLWKLLLDWGYKNKLSNQKLSLLADKYNKQLYRSLKLTIKSFFDKKRLQTPLLAKVITEYLSIFQSKPLRRHAWQTVRQRYKVKV